MAKKKTTTKKPPEQSPTKNAGKKDTSNGGTKTKTTEDSAQKKSSSKTSQTTKKSSEVKSTSKKKTTTSSLKKTSTTHTPKTTLKQPVKKTTTKKSTPKPAKTDQQTPEQIQEEKERIEAYKKAGTIAKKLKALVKPKIVPGAKLIEIVEFAEKKIIELGGKPGFPVNISINNVAAHYTPPPGDTTEIQDGDIIKFDHGVHIDGYCVDTAFTISLNNDTALKNIVKASEEAVEKAIKKIKHGVTTNILGGVIEETVRKYGFKPIINLQGHRIERWDLHAGKSIPCIALPTGDTMEEGEIYAVEVFVSNGEGEIHAQQSNAQIFQLIPTTRKIPLRTKSSRRILGYIAREFKSLPFSRFQVHQEFPQGSFGLLELIKTNKLEKHNILSEKKGFYVAQTEETILVTKNGCEILT